MEYRRLEKMNLMVSDIGFGGNGWNVTIMRSAKQP